MESSDNGRMDDDMVYDKDANCGMADRSEEKENETRPQKENHDGKEPEESTEEGPGTDGEGKKNAKRRRRWRREGSDSKKAGRVVRNDGKLQPRPKAKERKRRGETHDARKRQEETANRATGG